VALDPLERLRTEGLRLQEAVDTEYRTARREGTWGHSQPQVVERWRLALRAWSQSVEAALGADPAALGRFRGAPPATAAPTRESVDWLQIRNALAGKMTLLGALLEERKAGGRPGVTPPRSVWRKP
jgi:hypothetical protein